MRIVPAPERLLVVPGFEDLVYEARPLLVVPDSRGRVLNWIHALAQPWYAAIVVLTSQAITAATCGGRVNQISASPGLHHPGELVERR